MDLSQLPPRPDPETGAARPPPALLERGWRPAERERRERSQIPAPPKGEGPVLEWFQRTRLDSFMPGVILAVIMMVFLTVRDTGFGWMRVWWLWLFVVLGPIYFYFAARDRMSAGADWYKRGRRYVKTYELTSVKVKGTPGSWTLDLRDAEGRKVWTELDPIQQHPRLWDLVYNGIRHSVGHGAQTNRRALDRLQLQ